MALQHKHWQAITALVSGKSNADVALDANIGLRTLYRWLAENEEFKRALNVAESRLVGEALRQLVSVQHESISALAEIMREESDISQKRQAAKHLIDFTFKAQELNGLVERIDALEAKV